jgi:hypothetical protein
VELSADSLKQLFDMESLNAVLPNSNAATRDAILAPARLHLSSGQAAGSHWRRVTTEVSGPK